ncbi:MAG: hypothetical protein AAF725_23475 [Acidobacteriota bacterium]
MEIHQDSARSRVPTDSSPIHPYSAGLLILVDNVLFGANAVTMGLATPLVALVAFTMTSASVFLTQRFLAGGAAGPSLAQGVFLGILAGLPTSLTGTGTGLALLAKAGFTKLLHGRS